MQPSVSRYRSHVPFLAVAAGAVLAAAVVWFAMPHEKHISGLWVLLVKLVPFVLAVEAIARLDLAPAVRRLLALAAVPVTFLVFFCFFVPKIFFYSDDGAQLYYHVLTLTPFIICSLVLAFRLGGGAAETVRRLGFAMLLLMLSGLEDLAFLTVNHHTDPAWTPIPETWTWADHMTVFLGHPLSKTQAYVFIAVHVVLAGLVLFAPVPHRRRRPAPAPPAAEVRASAPVGAASR